MGDRLGAFILVAVVGAIFGGGIGVLIRNYLVRSKVSKLQQQAKQLVQEAEQKGLTVDTITINMNSVDRAILESDDDGFLDVYVKKGTDKRLGATMTARHAGEMISEITLAMVADAGLGTIAKTIHPYPTQAEAIKKAGDAYSRSRLTPLVQRIFKALLKLRRF